MPRKKIAYSAGTPVPLHLDETKYKYAIDGMIAQGVERADAVETLSIGMSQANGYSFASALVGLGLASFER